MKDLKAVYKAIALEVQQRIAEQYSNGQPICKLIRTADRKSKIRVCHEHF